MGDAGTCVELASNELVRVMATRVELAPRATLVQDCYEVFVMAVEKRHSRLGFW
jgi:hypothetical protein